MLNIGDYQFEIAEASFSGTLNKAKKIEWDIEIIGKLDVLGDQAIEPNIFIEKYPWEIKNLEDIFKEEIEIPSAKDYNNKETGRTCGILLKDTNPLDKNKLQFYLDKNDEIHLIWSAVFKSGFFGRMDIEIDTAIEFLGINIGNLKQDELKDLPIQTDIFQFIEEDGEAFLIL